MEQLAPLQDSYARTVSYLRMSVTDRCDLRCTYCMPERMTFLPKRDLLSLEELSSLAEIFISLGVRKIRLTGGEPLVRKNILWLIEQLQPHLEAGCLEEVCLTTNGTLLSKYAQSLYDLGVRRVNVSLDTLTADRYAEITRWGDIKAVFDGLEKAKQVGLNIKLNCVALKGFNEDEVNPLITYCAQECFDLVFIEVMPMGDLGAQTRLDQYLPLSQLQQRIHADWGLTPLSINTGGPSRYYRNDQLGSRIGFISPLTHNFCEGCNRVRLTCTGTLFTCLGQEGNIDLRTPLRDPQAPRAKTLQALREGILRKPKGHDFKISRKEVLQTNRTMNTTGG